MSTTTSRANRPPAPKTKGSPTRRRHRRRPSAHPCCSRPSRPSPSACCSSSSWWSPVACRAAARRLPSPTPAFGTPPSWPTAGAWVRPTRPSPSMSGRTSSAPYCGRFTEQIESLLVPLYVEARRGSTDVPRPRLHRPGVASTRPSRRGSPATWGTSSGPYHDLLFANQHGENKGAFIADAPRRHGGRRRPRPSGVPDRHGRPDVPRRGQGRRRPRVMRWV